MCYPVYCSQIHGVKLPWIKSEKLLWDTKNSIRKSCSTVEKLRNCKLIIHATAQQMFCTAAQGIKPAFFFCFVGPTH